VKPFPLPRALFIPQFAQAPYQNPPPLTAAQFSPGKASLSRSYIPPLQCKCIEAGVTWVTSHVQRVVRSLWQYYERTVLGPVPVAGVATWLQVKLQLIAAGLCHLTEQVVADPVVADRVVETNFILRPGTIEEVGPVDLLLDQQRDAVGYTTFICVSKLQAPKYCSKIWKVKMPENFCLARYVPRSLVSLNLLYIFSSVVINTFANVFEYFTKSCIVVQYLNTI